MPWEVLTATEIDEARSKECQDKRHHPPSTVVYTVLRWVCPACGAKSVVFPSVPTPQNPGD